MTTPILKITELVNNQRHQFATANEAFRRLEAASNDAVTIDLSSANASLDTATFNGAFVFSASGHSVARELEIPQQKRFFAVSNIGSGLVTLVRGDTELTINPDSAGIFYSDGTEHGVIAIASGGAGGGGGYSDVAVSSNDLDLSGLGLSVDVVRVTLDQDVTAIGLPSAEPDTYRELLILFTQDAIGGRSVSGWGGVSWEGGSAPTIDGDADAVTAVALVIFGDSVIYGGV